MASPYRRDRLPRAAAPLGPCPDVDLVVVGALLWGVSLVRVATAVSRRDADAETALATLTLLLVPWLARHALARLRTTLGDPLFVRAGAALKPTSRAEALAAPVRELLARAEAVGQGLRVGRIEAAGLGQLLFVGLDQPG